MVLAKIEMRTQPYISKELKMDINTRMKFHMHVGVRQHGYLTIQDFFMADGLFQELYLQEMKITIEKYIFTKWVITGKMINTFSEKAG